MLFIYPALHPCCCCSMYLMAVAIFSSERNSYEEVITCSMRYKCAFLFLLSLLTPGVNSHFCEVCFGFLIQRHGKDGKMKTSHLWGLCCMKKKQHKRHFAPIGSRHKSSNRRSCLTERRKNNSAVRFIVSVVNTKSCFLSLCRWECDEEKFQSVRPWAAPRPSRCRPCPAMRRDAARPTATATSSPVSSRTDVNKIFTAPFHSVDCSAWTHYPACPHNIHPHCYSSRYFGGV